MTKTLRTLALFLLALLPASLSATQVRGTLRDGSGNPMLGAHLEFWLMNCDGPNLTPNLIGGQGTLAEGLKTPKVVPAGSGGNLFSAA